MDLEKKVIVGILLNISANVQLVCSILQEESRVSDLVLVITIMQLHFVCGNVFENPGQGVVSTI